ncbi:MAG TPA: tetratricopeptide repeat protein [Candidatus Obscuribacter sp.]|nr:tetratricopeptide repeat protein [Candidatus Obscuribacter sp.]
MTRVSKHKSKGRQAGLKARAFLCGGFTLLMALSLNLGQSAQPGQAIMGSLDSPMDLRLQAMDYLLKGDKEQALGLYGTAIDAASETYGANSIFLADICYEAGALANRMDKFDKAENYLRQAVAINPRLAMARMELAEVTRRRNKPTDALEQIQQDLSNHPDSLIARQQFIRWLGANGKTPTDKSIAHQESLRLLAAIHRKPAPSIHINETKPLQRSKEDSPPAKAVPTPAPEKPESAGSSFRLPGRPSVNTTPTTAPAPTPAQIKQAEEKLQKTKKVEKPKKVERVEKPEPKPHKEVKPAPVKEAPPQAVKEKPPAQSPAPAAPKATKEAVAAEKPKKEKTEQPKQAEQVVPQTVPSMPVQPGYPMYSPVPVMVSPPAKVGKGKGGLVPPPPPTMPPLYPGMAPGMAPMPMPMIMPQQQQPPIPKKEKPKPPPKKVEEETKEVEDKPPPMQNPPSDADGDFMLDWGGVKKGKGKGK